MGMYVCLCLWWCVCVFDPTEAREVFIKQFTQLEASTHPLSVQLRGAGSTLDCKTSGDGKDEGDEEEDAGRRSVCRTLAGSLSAVQAVQTQLQKATLDLENMVCKHTHTHSQRHTHTPTHTYQTHTRIRAHHTHMHTQHTCTVQKHTRKVFDVSLTLLWAVQYTITIQYYLHYVPH